jgi:hypothetical protein
VGKAAQDKAARIPELHNSRHLVLRSVHPSPLSAHRGFFGSRPFSQANAFLTTHRRQPIAWCLSQGGQGASPLNERIAFHQRQPTDRIFARRVRGGCRTP